MIFFVNRVLSHFTNVHLEFCHQRSYRSYEKWRNILHFRWSEMITSQFYTFVAQALFAIYLSSIILTTTILYRIHKGRISEQNFPHPDFPVASVFFFLFRGDTSPFSYQSIYKWPYFLLVCANYKHRNVFCIFQNFLCQIWKFRRLLRSKF